MTMSDERWMRGMPPVGRFRRRQLPGAAVRVLAACALLSTVQSVATRAQEVLTLPGKTIEVLGLQRWTVPMIQDSLRKYAPQENIGSHACAAVLREKLGFATAAVTTYSGWPLPDTLEHVIIYVVEPQDSARVRHRMMPLDTTAPYLPWKEAVDVVNAHPGSVQSVLQSYLAWRRQPGRAPAATDAGEDSAAMAAYRRFLAAHRSARDYATARRLLLTSPDYPTRTVAVSVLGNFVGRDPTLYLLLRAVRENEGMVSAMAGVLLSTIAREGPRKVDWRRAAPSLHAVLDGASPFQLSAILDLLLGTGVNESLARPLLKNGGHMVIAMSGSHLLPASDPARRLLVALAGRDLGSPAAWQSWVDRL
jgi:hypothetical protein